MRCNRRKKRRNGANFGDEKFGLVNRALTALYRVPITTDTLLYAYFDVQFPYEIGSYNMRGARKPTKACQS